MTDAEYEAQRARVQALCDRWLGPLRLLWWTIVIVWNREHNHDAPEEAMHCSVEWNYNRATITVNLPEIADYIDDQLEWTFVHECMHIFVNETRPMDDPKSHTTDWLEHEEHACSALASAFISLRDFAKEGKL